MIECLGRCLSWISFQKLYAEILDDFPSNHYLDEFISEIFVVACGNRFVTTRLGDFIYMVGCKPHCCASSRLFILFDPQAEKVWASAYDLGVNGHLDIWLGQPNKKTKKLMRTLESMISWK